MCGRERIVDMPTFDDGEDAPEHGLPAPLDRTQELGGDLNVRSPDTHHSGHRFRAKLYAAFPEVFDSEGVPGEAQRPSPTFVRLGQCEKVDLLDVVHRGRAVLLEPDARRHSYRVSHLKDRLIVSSGSSLVLTGDRARASSVPPLDVRKVHA